MMKGAYNDPKNRATLPSYITKLSTDEIIKNTWLNKNDLKNLSTGFQAAAYYNSIEGKVTIAFAGTNDLNDVGTDINQSLGNNDPQYNSAMRVAQAFQYSKYGQNLEFVGHSLGGALASLAAITTNTNATTYNAAGLSNYYIDRAKEYGTKKYTGRVDAYSSQSDPLTMAQTLLPLPKAYGTPIIIPSEPLASTLKNNAGNPAMFVPGRLTAQITIDNHMFGPLKKYVGGN